MSYHRSVGRGVVKAPRISRRTALGIRLFCLVALAVGCQNPTAPKALSMDVLPGSYLGIGSGAIYDPPGPRLLYDSPSLRVEAVSAVVMITSSLTYTLTADFRVTRADGSETVEWKSAGVVRSRLPTGDGLPSDNHFLLFDLVDNKSSLALAGLYTAPYCMSGFGLSVSTTQSCVTMPATLGIGGVVPRSLIPDGPDISFGYEMK